MAAFSDTAFSKNAFSDNAFAFGAGTVVSRDTHDGFDEEVHKRVKKKVREEEEAFRSKRDRLREVIARAYDPEHGKVEVQELASPFVEILESGTPRIDYEALERNKEVLAEILAFQGELRREFDKRMAEYEADEEDVALLIQWN